VIGVESVEQAVEDARVNAAINNIGNISFYISDAREILKKEFFEQNGYPGLVVTDPPRAGMHERVVEALLRVKPSRVIYISCNPATQARDISLMKDHYMVAAIQPVDMFPHTHHIENVVLLKLRKP
jgi:23S rRNA (uracil1939-C5)-methyltransferase